MGKFKFSLKLNAFLLLFSLPIISWAGCQVKRDIQESTPLITLEIPPQVSTGDILGYSQSRDYVSDVVVATCDNDSAANYESTALLPASPTVSGAYETGIPGVGVFIGDLYSQERNIPYKTTISAGLISPWRLSKEIKLTFVKTGPISPGTIGSVQYSRYSLNNNTIATLSVQTLTVKKKSCFVDVNSKNQTINLGNHGKNEFAGIGSIARSSERDFKITIQCAAENTPVFITFDRVGASPGNGLLALDSSSSARGVAVEVLDSGKNAMIFGAKTRYGSATSKTIEVPLTARYKQIGDISPGSANAAMTFTVTQH